MRFTNPLFVTAAALASTVFTGGFAPPAAKTAAPLPRFEIAEVTGPPGVIIRHAAALNDKGQVVVQGYIPQANNSGSKSGSGDGSFLWEQGKTPRDLGRLPNGYHLQPLAINNAEQVVGIAWGDDDPKLRKRRAFISEKGKARDLGTPEGETSEAFDINERGEVFVTSYAVNDTVQPNVVTASGAFLWTAAKGFQPLPKRFDGTSAACALNDRGQIAGSGMVTRDEWRDAVASQIGGSAPDTDGVVLYKAFLYGGINGTFDRLPVEGSWATHAEAINNGGEVLLFADFLTAKSYPLTQSGGLFLWRGGRATLISANTGSGRMVYGMMGRPSLNDAGDVTTTVYSKQGKEQNSHAVLWRKGTLHRLDDCVPPNSGWHLFSARQINNRGQIIGMGILKGKVRPYFLTPTAPPK